MFGSTQTAIPKKTILFNMHTERIRVMIPLIQALSEQNFHILCVFRWKADSTHEAKGWEIVNQYPEKLHAYPRLWLQKIPNVEFQYIGDHQSLFLRLFKRYFLFKFKIFGKKPLLNIYMETKYTNWGQTHFEKFFSDTFNHDYIQAKKIIEQYNVRAIVMTTDKYYGEGEVGFAKIGKEKSIPIVLPHTIYHGPSIMAFKNNPKFLLSHPKASQYQIDTFNKFKSPKYGNQLFEEHFFYPAFMMNVLEKFGIFNKNPWYIGAGTSDYILVDNRHTAKRYIENLTPPNKIRIIGEFFYDDLYRVLKEKEKIKNALCSKYGLNPTKKIVIISLPQLWEHNILPKEQHWIEIDFLMRTLADFSNEVNILISLHPKSSPQNYEFLESQFPCTLLHESLAEVLPIADMFTATFSSTVMWSVLCGIPTVVFDFYNLHYTMYDFLSSVKIVNQKEKLSTTLQETLNTQKGNFEADWKALSRHEVFDGKVIERHLEFFNTL